MEAAIITHRHDRSWIIEVNTNLSPCFRRKSWRMKTRNATQQKIVDRIMEAWTAWIDWYSLNWSVIALQVLVFVVHILQTSVEKLSPTHQALSIVEMNSSAAEVMWNTIMKARRISILELRRLQSKINCRGPAAALRPGATVWRRRRLLPPSLLQNDVRCGMGVERK